MAALVSRLLEVRAATATLTDRTNKKILFISDLRIVDSELHSVD
jgi:hypothetical protein